jgi:hypothetical protein
MHLKTIAPHFVVPDVVRAAEYYRDKFGFEIRGFFANPPVFTIVRREEIEIHLGKSSDGTAARIARRASTPTSGSTTSTRSTPS